MNRFLSVCEKNDWILIHISETIQPRVTKFGQGMDFDDLIVDLEGQGDRSKVTRSKKHDLSSRLAVLQVILEVKGHICQGQRSRGSRLKVTWVKISLKITLLAGGLTSTSSCFILQMLTV